MSRRRIRWASLAIPPLFVTGKHPRMRTFPFEAFRVARFGAGLFCPRCGDRRVSSWGQYNGRRRYRCSGCLRTFSDFTETPFAYLKRIDCWPHYRACLEAGSSVRVAAAAVGIHKDTAFRWRHRFLSAMRRMASSHAYGGRAADEKADAVVVPLKGRIQVGDRWLPESLKGRRTLPRPPRRFGYRGLSFQTAAAWIMIAVGERGGIVARHVGPSRPRPDHLARSLAPLLTGRRTLVSRDGPYGAAATMAVRHGHDHLHVHFRSSDPRDCIRAYWRSLDVWIERFRGVSTHYLRNYLFWHQWVAVPQPWRIEPSPWLIGTTTPEDRERGPGQDATVG